MIQCLQKKKQKIVMKILKEDIVIGLAASGRTPFVIGAFGLCK